MFHQVIDTLSSSEELAVFFQIPVNRFISFLINSKVKFQITLESRYVENMFKICFHIPELSYRPKGDCNIEYVIR